MSEQEQGSQDGSNNRQERMDSRHERLRAQPVRGVAGAVDRAARVIYGVSVAQAVEAVGHGLVLDGVTLDQLVACGNARPKGVKAHFTHPGLSADGLGKFLGRLTQFRREGECVRADFQLSETAFRAPEGNLGDYVLDMAADEPDMFGMSVVINLERVWVLASGEEVPAEDTERPAQAVTRLPVARVRELVACDVVDEPAANRNGLFSAHLWASNREAEAAFAELDTLRARWGVSVARAYEFALAYFAARGVEHAAATGHRDDGLLSL